MAKTADFSMFLLFFEINANSTTLRAEFSDLIFFSKLLMMLPDEIEVPAILSFLCRQKLDLPLPTGHTR